MWKMTLVGTVRKNKRFLPPNMQNNKTRAMYSTNFAFSKIGTLCSYVPKKNEAVIMLSSMHMSPEIDNSTEIAKPEIIKYYNKTKGGVDNMDKMLAEYTVKRKTSRWPLALFFNIIDISALAAYIIFMEHNNNIVSSDSRRKFLKTLSSQCCLENIEERAKNSMVISKLHVRSAIQDVLGRELTTTAVTASTSQTQRDNTGRIAVVGSCFICREKKLKERKTRKACTNCLKPVCNEHAVNRPICNACCQSSANAENI